MNTAVWVATVLMIALSISPATAAAGDVLVMRYIWAPTFCYAGSKDGVPEQFCGFTNPSQKRFLAHRASRIYLSNSKGELQRNCSGGVPYSSSALTSTVRQAMSCVNPSYTYGNADGWYKYVWDIEGRCVGRTVMALATPGKYFEQLTTTFKRYDVDMALKKAGHDMSKAKKIKSAVLLDVLEAAFGQRGYFSCDPGTHTYYSSFLICLKTTGSFSITKCPDKFLQPNKKCASPLLVRRDTAMPVPINCTAYYPAYSSF